MSDKIRLASLRQQLAKATQQCDALKSAMRAIVELGKASDVDAEPDRVFDIAEQALGGVVLGPTSKDARSASPPRAKEASIGEQSWLDERRVRDVVCPQCRKEFELSWNDWSNKPATLQIRGCPSGGIYDVIISCPHCNYEEPL